MSESKLNLHMYIVHELNDENSVVLIIHLYFRSKYLYLGNPPFLTLAIFQNHIKIYTIVIRHIVHHWNES